jgi:hypothetical protein
MVFKIFMVFTPDCKLCTITYLPDSFNKWDTDERGRVPRRGKTRKRTFFALYFIKSAFIRVYPPPIPNVSGG